MCDHLVGLQAQDTPPPFAALWSRITDFDPAVVSARNPSMVVQTWLLQLPVLQTPPRDP
ncbi:crosslink repair DNA glycosylase YcaQ family protein [Nocardia sp. NPDC046473]|uniref:DNA glycosylase AlkZ-like family protein n=1 Tax=Nocardia sp. NPDC046473 TaxID=3155733 RepID=UPI0033F5E005